LNLYAVDYALRHLGLSVAVVGAICMDRWRAGWLLGRWSLGQKDGRVVGGICWLTDDAHVALLTDDYLAAMVSCVPAACSKTICPWELFDVGAPKKKAIGKAVSKRGANMVGRSTQRVTSQALDHVPSGDEVVNVVSGTVGNFAVGVEPSVNVVPDALPHSVDTRGVDSCAPGSTSSSGDSENIVDLFASMAAAGVGDAPSAREDVASSSSSENIGDLFASMASVGVGDAPPARGNIALISRVSSSGDVARVIASLAGKNVQDFH